MSKTDSSKLADKIYRGQYCMNHRIEGPFGERLITFADYIGSGQSLQFVEKYIQQNILPTYANTHTEVSFTGKQTGHYREEARQLIKKSVNANVDDALIFCGSGSTGAINKIVSQFLGELPKKPLVFLGPYEHHSNVLPWRESGVEIISVPLTKIGMIDVVFLEEKLKQYQNTRLMIGSFSAASNVTGIISAVDEISTMLHQYGALSFWDYAAGAAYMNVNMNSEGLAYKDAIFISPHKVMGGPGTPGILLVKRKIFRRATPTQPGGGTVQFVTKTQQKYYKDIEVREEAGTPGIIESIRAGLIFKLKDAVGTSYIHKKETEYITRALDKFKKNKNILILGNTNVARLGFIAFLIKCENRFLHHNFVVALLNDLFGIQARGGCSCAGPYGHDLLEISEARSQAHIDELETGNMGTKPGWVRLNFNYFIPESEFQFIVDAIDWISENGWKLLKKYEFDDRNALWRVPESPISVNSLDSFLGSKPMVKPKSKNKRAEECKIYLLKADKISQTALNAWSEKPLQEYYFPQLQNNLRWYALADDLKIKNEGIKEWQTH